MDKEDFKEKAIAWVNGRSTSSFKAIWTGYEDPKSFVNQSNQTEVQPDISFITPAGAKHYLDIALKDDDVTSLVTRWKLLSIMANMKRGKLHLLAPKGHKMFTKKLVDQYNIDATVYSL